MNRKLTGGLFNKELKEGFLNQYSEQTARFYRYIFVKAYNREVELNKDIYKFTESELDSLLHQNYNSSLGSLQTVICILKRYLDFCTFKYPSLKIKNYFSKSQNDEDLKKYLQIKTEKYISKDEIKDIIGMCVNAQDAVIFALLFDGVKGEQAEELVNLRIKDCNFNKNVLRLRRNNGSERYLKVSDLTMNLIEKATEETEYIKNNGVESTDMKAKTYPITETEYVLRICAREPSGTIKPSNVIARLNRIKLWYGNPSLTVTSIWVSGMLDRYRFIQEQKEGCKLLTKEDYLSISRQFGYNNNEWFKTKERLKQLA